MVTRAFIHDANQSLHIIRLAAEALAFEQSEGRLAPERLNKRINAILSQVEHLTDLVAGQSSDEGD
ncbi:MAG: hypothetical protein AB7G62_15730 [Magnetospirillum sp.]